MEYQFLHLNQILIFAILAISLNLLVGYAGQISIAPAALAGVGGYTAAKLATAADFDFVPALTASVAVAFVVGVLLSLPALRLSVQHLILLTLAFSIVMVSLVTSVADLGGAYGIQRVPNASLAGQVFSLPSERFWLSLVLTVAVFLIYWRIVASPLGRLLKAIREDEVAARSLGKNVFFYKVQVFGITSAMAGLAGALIAFYFRQATPSLYNVTQSLLIFTMVIFGGMGNLIGPVAGAAAIWVSGPVLEKNLDIAAEKAALWRLVIYGAAIVLLMRLRPEGLFPERMSLAPLARWAKRWWPAHQALEVSPADPAAGAGAARAPPAASTSTQGQDPGQPQPNPAPTDAQVLVAARGLKKSFGGIAAVDGIDFVLPEGRITGLIGPNGAGKTTVFNLLTGMIPADEGTIELHGGDISGKTPDAIAKMGMVRSFQEVRLISRLTVLENVMLATFHHPGERFLDLFFRPLAVRSVERRARARALEVLSFVGLQDKANLLAGSLSFGEQKLVAIARLLATGAEVLMLDEPTSGVDPQWVENVANVIRALPEVGRTICIVEHNLNALEQIADHCYFMESGSITAEGSLRDLMNDPRLMEAYFGT